LLLPWFCGSGAYCGAALATLSVPSVGDWVWLGRVLGCRGGVCYTAQIVTAYLLRLVGWGQIMVMGSEPTKFGTPVTHGWVGGAADALVCLVLLEGIHCGTILPATGKRTPLCRSAWVVPCDRILLRVWLSMLRLCCGILCCSMRLTEKPCTALSLLHTYWLGEPTALPCTAGCVYM